MVTPFLVSRGVLLAFADDLLASGSGSLLTRDGSVMLYNRFASLFGVVGPVLSAGYPVPPGKERALFGSDRSRIDGDPPETGDDPSKSDDILVAIECRTGPHHIQDR